MPAKDFYHECVKNALIQDDWTITNDPLHLKWGAKDMYVDLGAERLLAAEKKDSKIAVEIKSFRSHSDMSELEKAVGQYIIYSNVLAEIEPERLLYLAIHQEIFVELFEEPIGQLLLKNNPIRLIVFNPQMESISRWIP